jgi:hypothetical protein
MSREEKVSAANRLPFDVVERPGPPGQQVAEDGGGGDRGEADAGQLDREPPGARDALGPGELVGAGF